MKVTNFVIFGIFIGIVFTLIDTIVGNSDISPIEAGPSALLKNISAFN